MADLYDNLSPSAQTAFRSRLFSLISSDTCPTVDLSTVTSIESLSDPGNRALAIDCFQTANGLGASGAGVLDAQTYGAVMGHPSGWSTGEKIVAGVLGVAAVLWLARGKGKRRRR